jgi:galactose-1-phosphate uridylyltransferase
MTEKILSASKSYLKKNNGNYWDDIVKLEKQRMERFIATSDGIEFLASYSPFGNNEVLIIFNNKSFFTELEDTDVSNLASGIERILKGYEEMGVESFNLTTYSGPINGDADGFNLNMRIISRAPPLPYYTSDVGFMEGLHYERVVESLPEDVAQTMRRFFKKNS